tara:strand:+ start:625 stop:1599 length:975 start_codon:yes stop_codon:yes gene_type:complete
MESVLETWLFPKTNSNLTLETLYSQMKDMDFTSVIRAFTDRLDTIPYTFSKSEQVSGSICFFGGVFTSLLNYGYIEEIDGLFTFALCYMLIDHFLDDNTISQEEKSQSMSEIYAFLTEGKRGDNKLINAAGDRYLGLVERVPECQEYFMKLFKSELEGAQVEQRNDLDREVYRRNADEKGGLTATVIGSILGLKSEKQKVESRSLGRLIQINDDILDCIFDRSVGIYTLAIYDIDHGNLDQYVREAIIDIANLSNVYNFFKPILLLGVILGVHDNPGHLSEELNTLLQKYNPFNENTSKDSLSEWFHDKLYLYIDDRKIDFSKK